MGMKVNFTPAMLEVSIQNLAKLASGNASRAMRRAAIRIRDLARSYAPFKTGDLEKAIEYGVIRNNNRNVFVVYVDLDMVRSRGDGNIGDYAYIMEEELHPYGRQKGERNFKLGKGSLAKRRSTGKKVGGRFLSRAITEGAAGVIGDVVAEVRRTLGSSRVMDVAYRREPNSGEE